MNINEAIEAVKSNWPDERYTLLREALTTLIDSHDAIRRECAEIAERVVKQSPQDKYGGRIILEGTMAAAIMNARKE